MKKILGFLAILVLLPWAFFLPANAQTIEISSTPSICFLDERDLVVDFDRLSTDLNNQVAIELRNNEPTKQKVELTLVGLTPLKGDLDPAFSKLFTQPLITDDIEPYKIKKFIITFDTSLRPKKGNYEGLLVATITDNGDVVRRKFILQVGTPKSSPSLASLPDSITLQGTKKFPSVLSTFYHENIFITSADLSAYLGNSPVGAVSGSGGNLGILTWQNNELEIQGVENAGKYEGSVNLVPNVSDKTTIKATINIRDFWVWALLIIALGVIIGAAIMHFYSKHRPKLEIEKRSAFISKEIVEAETLYQRRPIGEKLFSYSMLPLAGEILTQASKKDSKNALLDLDGLESYVIQFRNLHNQLVQMEKAHSIFYKHLTLEHKESHPDDVKSIREAYKCLVGKVFILKEDEKDIHDDLEFVIDEKDAKKLKDLSAKTELYTNNLRALSENCPVIDNVIKYRDNLLHSPIPLDLKELLDKKENNLEKCQLDAFNANEVKEIEKAANNAKEIADLIKKLVNQLQNQKQISPSISAIQKPSTGDVGKTSTEPIVPIPSPDESRLKDIEISWEIQSPVGTKIISSENKKKKCRGNSEDIFVFSSSIASLGKSFPRLIWFFEENITEIAIVSDNNIKTRHRFPKPGRYQVYVKGTKEESVRLNVEVTKPRTKEITIRLYRFDFAMTLVTGFLAVGSGFLALYSSTWGTPADYLKAFLWGSVTSEGLKYVKNVIDRIWQVT
jgi:hypothetical protein